MENKPPFDPTKAFFYLIGGVFGTAAIVILTTLIMCMSHFEDMIQGHFKCDADNRVFDLMATLISSVLALYAGSRRSDK
jgi:hypothetical protein